MKHFLPHLTKMDIVQLRIHSWNLEDKLFRLGAMNEPPCFICGYNGQGYYQPDQHPCAERHHKLYNGSKR